MSSKCLIVDFNSESALTTISDRLNRETDTESIDDDFDILIFIKFLLPYFSRDVFG